MNKWINVKPGREKKKKEKKKLFLFFEASGVLNDYNAVFKIDSILNYNFKLSWILPQQC